MPAWTRDLSVLQKRPDWLWSPLKLLVSAYQSLFPGGKAAGAWRWQFIVHLVPWLRMSGTTLALPSVTWRAQGQLCVLLHNGVQVTRIFLSSVPPCGYLKAERKIPINTINRDYRFNPFVANYALVEVLLWKNHRKQFLF